MKRVAALFLIISVAAIPASGNSAMWNFPPRLCPVPPTQDPAPAHVLFRNVERSAPLPLAFASRKPRCHSEPLSLEITTERVQWDGSDCATRPQANVKLRSPAARHNHRGLRASGGSPLGCLSVFGINTTVGVEHARPILLMCRNYCRLLEGSSMLDPYNEHHPETGYAPLTETRF